MRKNIFRAFFVLALFLLISLLLNDGVFAMNVSQVVEQETATIVPDSGGPIVVPPTPPPTPPPVPPIIPLIPPPPIPPVPPVEPPVVPPIIPPIEPPIEPPITPPVPPVEPPVFPPIEKPVPPTPPSLGDQVESAFERTKGVVVSPAGKIFTGVAQPIGIISGAGLIALQAIISTASMTVTSVSDIFLLAWRLLGILFGAKKRRGKPWGTVYDSVTKRPLDPAYVVVSKETGEEVADAITDLDGRYGFLVPSGIYKLRANKTNYSFPTKNLAGRDKDELYENIYHDESVETKEGDIIVKNIPLDPIGFDWNEFEKNKQNLFRIYSDRERFWFKLFNIFYILGVVSAIFATIFDPRPVNFIFLGFYALFIIYNLLSGESKKAVSVKRMGNLEPIPFAIIKVFFAELNNQVKSVVADHLGRFYFLVGPGKYYVTIDEKLPDGSYKRIHETPHMFLEVGTLREDILV